MKQRFCFSYILVIIIAMLCSLTGCKDDAPQTSKGYSFYHWKTTLDNSDYQNKRLEQSGSDVLYLKMFDLQVDPANDQVFPTATIQFVNVDLPVGEVIPVIYIKNEVFHHTDTQGEKLNVLVTNVASKLKRLIYGNLSGKVVREVQIDCDWTDSTQERYFEFLNILKIHPEFQSIANAADPNKIKLSCTIRWHQVKFRERTGVPPVDSGVIMAYNVGDLSDVNEVNSIINNKTTSNYVKRLVDYPLPYDVALPMFEWIVQYREDKIIGLHSNYDKEQMEDHTIPGNDISQRQLSQDFKTNNAYFYKGDVLRTETVVLKELQDLASMIKQNSSQDYHTIYYHLNSSLLLNYTHEQLSQLAR